MPQSPGGAIYGQRCVFLMDPVERANVEPFVAICHLSDNLSESHHSRQQSQN